MKLPALPKKKGSENKTDGPQADEGQSKRKPKVVFYQGLIAPRPIDKTEKKIPVSEWEL